MSSPSLFPPLPRPQLSREQVISYLVGCKADGHDVYQAEGHHFVLVLNDQMRIDFLMNEVAKTCQVQSKKCGNCVFFRDVETALQLEHAIREAAAHCGLEWPSRPTTGRLSAATPATNLRTIGQLIGPSKIEAVFDPYLDNDSLVVIIDILSFGSGGVANGVRLLGSTRKTQGSLPKLTKTGVMAWWAQLSITGEVRVMPPDDQHRRFILLSGGKSLILGPSLNSIHKNEAAHIEPDSSDRAFFDQVWATAIPL